MTHPHLYQIAALLILTIYLVVTYMKYGWLKSISASFYTEGRDGYVFTLTLMVIAVLVMISFQNVLMFLSGSLLCFTAAAPDYKDKQAGTIHIIGATGSMILAYAALIVYAHWICIVPAVITGAFYLESRHVIRYPIYWTEVIGFYGILIFMIIV